MATHSSILAWRLPWTEEPGGLQSMGSQRVRHNWEQHTQGHYFLLQSPQGQPDTRQLWTACKSQSLLKWLKWANPKSAYTASPISSWENHNKGSCHCLCLTLRCSPIWCGVPLTSVSKELWVKTFPFMTVISMFYRTWVKQIPGIFETTEFVSVLKLTQKLKWKSLV